MRHDDQFGDDELEESEFREPDEDDGEDDETVPCPYCHKPVYEDAERCPACGNYLSREDAPSRPATWLVVTVIICLAIVLAWIIGGC